MVKAMYQHPLIPYRYLGPFAFDKWDTVGAFRSADSTSMLGKTPLLVLQSGGDELVPPSMTRLVFEAARGRIDEPAGAQGESSSRRYHIVQDALHDTAFERPSYRKEILRFIEDTKPK